jgi:hypothetical protein
MSFTAAQLAKQHFTAQVCGIEVLDRHQVAIGNPAAGLAVSPAQVLL